MQEELEALESSGDNSLFFVWCLNTTQVVEFNYKVFYFELNKKYPFSEEDLRHPWVESAIMKGYLKAIS